jgi:hypothetical protein
VTDAPAAEPAAASAGPGPSPSRADEDAALPMDNRTARTYPDGLAVRLGKPTRFTPSAWAAGHTPGNSAFTFTVTLINNGSQPVDVTLCTVDVKVGRDGVHAEQVVDQGKADFVRGTIAPGRSGTFKVGFSAASKDLTVIDVTVTPTVSHGAALFTGKVG